MPMPGASPGSANQPVSPAELARLATMAVRARIIIEGAYAGLHHNPRLGTAIEFSEHKEYAPGDDIRRIDWKAVGRQDRYYIKRFEDESEMRTFLLLDASASMGYKNRGVSKLTYATYLAAALAYLLGKQGDPAGLCLHDTAMRNYLPPSGRAGQVRDMLQLLEGVKPSGNTDMGRALERIGDLAERKSLILIFSDLLDLEPPVQGNANRNTVSTGPAAEHLAQLRQRGHDVVVFHLLDPDEVELPFEDLTEFLAVEPGDTRTLLCEPDDLREAFAQASLDFRDRWRRACVQARIEYRFASTLEPPGNLLRAFIGQRQRRSGQG
ncbi:MAG: DUF58 domain-containing protein [Deltaproteobacteria bacterium]|nr:DUF58 domain-containing protein [Deltaproteobacteria bacterium]